MHTHTFCLEGLNRGSFVSRHAISHGVTSLSGSIRGLDTLPPIKKKNRCLTHSKPKALKGSLMSPMVPYWPRQDLSSTTASGLTKPLIDSHPMRYTQALRVCPRRHDGCHLNGEDSTYTPCPKIGVHFKNTFTPYSYQGMVNPKR